MIKVMMYGCNGHMGHVVCDLIKDTSDMEVAAGMDVTVSEDRDFPVFTSFEDVNVPVDVII
ncbi:MAG: 4-hydroxy-tetrahydrodipicolinate reductase, partial [Clostridiales bacterium]|nr:4-hydroxy-tetrahydrodipicolinate reductase [Clostridiales bacterium]